MFACIHAPGAGALAQTFSPWIEMVDEATAVFALTPLQLANRVWENLPAGTRVAVAATVDAAILAARHMPGRTFLAPGEESRIWNELPIDCLPPDPEIFETLDLWGIRTLGELARLPEEGIAGRLGPRGLRLQKLARGTLERPLRPGGHSATYEESAELEYPLDLREPLLFLIGRFLFDLTARLKTQSLAAREVRLRLNGQERTLRLPFPTRDIKFLLRLMEHALEAQPPGEPVTKVRLAIEPTEPRRVQHGLFVPAAPEPEKLELTLAKIRALVGAENVRIPRIRDTYRPGWGAAESRLAFRHFRPPLEARVETEAGIPKHIWTRAFRGQILKAAGPWRSSGDWWRPDLWDRDEWDLYLSDGALYRLYQDRPPKKWFVQGCYD